VERVGQRAACPYCGSEDFVDSGDGWTPRSCSTRKRARPESTGLAWGLLLLRRAMLSALSRVRLWTNGRAWLLPDNKRGGSP